MVSAYEPAPARVGGTQRVAEAAEWSIGPDFKVDAVLERAEDLARGEGIDIEAHGPKGEAAGAVLEVAKQQDADLIVLGSRECAGRAECWGACPTRSLTGHPATC